MHYSVNELFLTALRVFLEEAHDLDAIVFRRFLAELLEYAPDMGDCLRLVVLNGKAVGKSKSYYVYVNPSDVVNLGSSWTEVTKTWQNRYNIQFGNMRMYTCSNIAGFSGNIGYLFTIPAERVQMKVMEKNDLGVDLVKMSPAVRNNRDWTLFLCHHLT